MKKIVMVTGAAGNLGTAVVKKFMGEGFHVVGVVEEHQLSRVKSNSELNYIGCDLNNLEKVGALAEIIRSRYDTLNVLVNLVGGFTMSNLESTTLEDLRKMFSLNFETTFNITKAIYPIMKASKGGIIIFTGAKPALNLDQATEVMPYALSKSLVFSFAEILNAQGAKDQIKTAVIVPSIIDTPPNREAMPSANFSNWVKSEEIANIIYYACSEKAAPLRQSIFKVYGNS